MASSPGSEPPGGGPDAGPEGEPDEDDAPEGDRVLVVALGAAWLAIDTRQVDAVVRPAPVTPVAGTPAWVLGVAAVRGRVLPVVEVRRLAVELGAPAAEGGAGDDAAPWFVVVDDGRRAAALAGLRVLRVVPVGGAPGDGAPGGGAPGGDGADEAGVAPAVPGLPARGVARLEADTTRGADALPPAARLLDAAALLDLVHDPTGD